MKDDILNLFAYEARLSFTEINDRINSRSNHLAYWLNKLVSQKILRKDSEFYSLDEDSEHLIPYLSSSKTNLPVVVVQIKKGEKVFLHKRKKRPYKDLLSLPGGRLLLGESIEEAAKRIMSTKFSIDVNKIKLRNIFLEHVRKRSKIVYSFMIFLVSAEAKDRIGMSDIEANKRKIIPSDYKMIRSASQNISIGFILSSYK